VIIQALDAGAHAIISDEEALQSLSSLSGKGVGSITILHSRDPTPTGSAVYVVGSSAAVFLEVKGRVDVDDEIKKAQAKLRKASEGAAKQHKIVGDKDFAAKVSQGVLETERAKLDEFETQQRNYERSIEQFSQLKLES
jgi:valyl-tRNA synthetase